MPRLRTVAIYFSYQCSEGKHVVGNSGFKYVLKLLTSGIEPHPVSLISTDEEKSGKVEKRTTATRTTLLRSPRELEK